jgi:nicotinamidase-related amidase
VTSAPSPDELTPDWVSSALLVIDFQRDLADDGDHPIPGTSTVAPAVRALTEAFRRAKRPIVHVVRLYSSGDDDIDLPRRGAIRAGTAFLAPGTEGSQVIKGVLPQDEELDPQLLLTGEPQRVGPDEVIVFKPRWSAFHRTRLHEWLTERGVTSLVVAGCNLPNCPRATLFDASNHDYRAALAVDAVSQVTQARLDDLTLIGIQLLTAAQAQSELERVAVTPTAPSE